MKKFFLRIAAKWAWPALKENILQYVKNENLQIKFVKLLNKKLDIPNLSEEVERKLLDAAYDAAQELITEQIEKVNLVEIVNNM